MRELLWVVVVLASVTGRAEERSVITGTVTDAETGQPIVDVIVTATSPVLSGEEIVVTDPVGHFRIAELPPGLYTLKFEKEGYGAYSRAAIEVQPDRHVRMTIQLVSRPEDLELGWDGPPLIDLSVHGATQTFSISYERVGLASLRSDAFGVQTAESLALLAPQVRSDPFGLGIAGAQSAENRYLLDDVSTNDPLSGRNGLQLPLEFLEEAAVITSGETAEYGKHGGGVLRLTGKSGSNELQGSVWGTWAPGVLAGQTPRVTDNASSIAFHETPWNTFDIGATVGGPIIKDKLWFFVGVSPSLSRTQQARSLRRFLLNSDATDFQYDAHGDLRTEALPNTTTSQFSDARALRAIGRLTYLINSDHNFDLTVVSAPSSTTQPSALTTPQNRIAWNGGGTETTNTTLVSLRGHFGFLDKHLLGDVIVGWFHRDSDFLPNDGSRPGSTDPQSAYGAPRVELRRSNADDRFGVTSPYSVNDLETFNPTAAALCEPVGARSTRLVTVRGQSRVLFACPATGQFGGIGAFTTSNADRFQGRASLLWRFSAFGHHAATAGFELEHLRATITRGTSGGVSLVESLTGSRFDDTHQLGSFTGPDEAVRTSLVTSHPSSWNVGAFVQDSWSIADLVTLNVGLRYDTQQLFTSNGELGLSLANQLSPRVGLVYDPTQEGRSRLYAGFSTYFQSMPLELADRAHADSSGFRFRHERSACDPLKDFNQVFAQCNDPQTYQPVNRLLGDAYGVNAAGTMVGSRRAAVDPNLQPQSTSELVVGGEYRVLPDGTLSLVYTKRWLTFAIEQLSLDEGGSTFLGNPGYGLASAFPKAARDYDAVTALFAKRFSDRWLAQASYTFSSLRGNVGDPSANLLGNRTGPLDADHTHVLKVFGAKEFQLTPRLFLMVGLTYLGQSGAPINVLTSQSLVLPRGAGGRLPFLHEIDARLAMTYALTKHTQFQLSVDLFNLFNFQAVTSVDSTLSHADLLPFQAPAGIDARTAACLAGTNQPQCPANGLLPLKEYDPLTGAVVNASSAQLNSNFKQPTGYQPPLSVRFGARFSF